MSSSTPFKALKALSIPWLSEFGLYGNPFEIPTGSG
jgi:hypothetical protein